MQSTTETTSSEENNTLQKEKQKQRKIKEAMDSFQDGKIVSKNIVKGNMKDATWDWAKYRPARVIEIDGETYPVKLAKYITDSDSFLNLKQKKASNVLSPDDTLFIVVYEVEFNNMKETVVSNAHLSLEKAKEEINNDTNPFRFKMQSLTTEHSSESFEDKKHLLRTSNNENIKKKIQELKEQTSGARLLLSITVLLPVTISLLSVNFFMNLFTMSGLVITIASSIALFAVMFLALLLSPTVVCYPSVKISAQKLNELNIYDGEQTSKSTYKSVSCEITRSEEGVHINSLITEDIDCHWFFNRDNTGLLCSEGQKFIRNYPGSGDELAITVTKSEDDEDSFVSECGKWKMTEEFL